MKYVYFLLGLIARLIIVAIPIFVINKYKDTLIQPLENWSKEATISTIGSLILLVFADYIKDFAKNYKSKKSLNPLQRASRETGATVTKLLEFGKFQMDDCDKIIEAALRQIESIVEVSLGKSRKENEISANCMLYRTQRKVGPSLVLTHWGTQLAGRFPIALKVGKDLPGAPKAIEENNIQYITDTQSKPNKNLFSNKTYKSIISIPLTLEAKKVGVINIDSEETNAFGKDGAFQKDILPIIQAQVDTITKLLLEVKLPQRLDSLEPIGA